MKTVKNEYHSMNITQIGVKYFLAVEMPVLAGLEMNLVT